MEQVTIIGIDLAKRVFQVHGAASDGMVVFRKKLSRAQFLPFLGRTATLRGGDGGLRDGRTSGGVRSARSGMTSGSSRRSM